MKIVFLSMLYQKDKEEEYRKKSKINLPNHLNTFQWDIIEGFDEILSSDFILFNQLPFAAYPSYKKLIFKTEKFTNRNNINDINIGYVNISIIKQISRERNYKKHISKFVKENSDQKICILVYGLYLPTLKIVKWLKKYKNVETAIIVPDLPMKYGVLPENIVKKVIYNFYGKKMMDMVNYADKYVLFSEEMKYPLQIQDKPYVVVEGVISKNSNTDIEFKKPRNDSNERIILYTGSLSYTFGIKNLIDAFSLIENKNLKLWICGSGEAENEIKKVQIKDDRVQFFGYVTKQEIYSLQDKADILINPRGTEGEYTKYSFPSKTFEYLKSGKPTIMCKLPSMPQEYFKYLYLLEDNSVEKIANKITIVASKTRFELDSMGQKAKKWVLENKNSNIQAQKIINLFQI